MKLIHWLLTPYTATDSKQNALTGNILTFSTHLFCKTSRIFHSFFFLNNLKFCSKILCWSQNNSNRIRVAQNSSTTTTKKQILRCPFLQEADNWPAHFPLFFPNPQIILFFFVLLLI